MNLRPADYKSAALPTELRQHCVYIILALQVDAIRTVIAGKLSFTSNFEIIPPISKYDIFMYIKKLLIQILWSQCIMQFNLRYKFLLNYINKKIPPAQHQLLKLGNCFICSRDIDFDISKNIISTTGTCGISQTLELAKIKAISEFVEREFCKDNNIPSNGFAAYPFIFNRNKALIHAKNNAFNELVERYALYMWAENNIKYLKYNIPEKYNQELYSAIQKEIPFLEFYKIIPVLTNTKTVIPVILYAKTEYGWAFSSAAAECVAKAEQNALKELYINCIGLYRIHKLQMKPSHNFEKQLLWVSQQEEFIQAKINSPGNISIQIPNALFRNIKTKYDDCYVVTQCYFEEYQEPVSHDKFNKMYHL